MAMQSCWVQVLYSHIISEDESQNKISRFIKQLLFVPHFTDYNKTKCSCASIIKTSHKDIMKNQLIFLSTPTIHISQA